MLRLTKREKKKRGNAKIGTTGRGIGPAYEDKVSRRGLRLGDMLNQTRFSEKLKEVMEYHNFALTQYYGEEALNCEQVLAESLEMAEQDQANDSRCLRLFTLCARSGRSHFV